MASFSFLVDSLTPRFTLRRQLGAHVGFSAFFFACSFVAFPLLLSKLVPFLSCGCSQNMCMSDVSATEDNFGGRQPKGREGVSLRVQAGKERGWSKAGGGAPRGRGEEPKSSPSLQAHAEFCETSLHFPHIFSPRIAAACSSVRRKPKIKRRNNLRPRGGGQKEPRPATPYRSSWRPPLSLLWLTNARLHTHTNTEGKEARSHAPPAGCGASIRLPSAPRLSQNRNVPCASPCGGKRGVFVEVSGEGDKGGGLLLCAPRGKREKKPTTKNPSTGGPSAFRPTRCPRRQTTRSQGLQTGQRLLPCRCCWPHSRWRRRWAWKQPSPLRASSLPPTPSAAWGTCPSSPPSTCLSCPPSNGLLLLLLHCRGTLPRRRPAFASSVGVLCAGAGAGREASCAGRQSGPPAPSGGHPCPLRHSPWPRRRVRSGCPPCRCGGAVACA